MSHVETVVELLVLEAKFERVTANLAQVKADIKLLKKLQNCKLSHKTAHKYFSLQETYMARFAG